MRLSDTGYFLTSASPDDVSAIELLSATRNHWQVENCVFFAKDRWWDEDRHLTKWPDLSEWLAQLTTAATMVLRFSRTTDDPLRALADYICWNPRLGLELLGLL